MKGFPRLVLLIFVMIWTNAGTQAYGVGCPFANPVMLYSRGGRLHVDLVAAPAAYTIEGHHFQGMFYNGKYIPPVWRVRPGDTLTVTLRNRLSEHTNLHFHSLSLDVSPLKNSDNVFLHISPSVTFTYEIRIPEKHVGLFWFHSHMHHYVDPQIIGGMSGGIIVDGSDRLYPVLKQLLERVLLLKIIPSAAPITRSWLRSMA